MLQCGVVCYSVLKCVNVCYSVLQCVKLSQPLQVQQISITYRLTTAKTQDKPTFSQPCDSEMRFAQHLQPRFTQHLQPWLPYTHQLPSQTLDTCEAVSNKTDL